MRNPSQLDRTLQRHAREYIESRDEKQIDMDEFVDWILQNKDWKPDPKRIKKILREDVSHALSEERFKDDDLRRVRRYHLIKRKRGDQQLSLWARIEHICPKDMQLSLQIRRKDLVSRAVQINNDKNHYNKYVNNGEPIQTSFDLTTDVKEAEATLAIGRGSSSSEPKRPSGRSPIFPRESSSGRTSSRP